MTIDCFFETIIGKSLEIVVPDANTTGTVVFGGDVHANYVADLKVDYDDAKAPVVATEFCGTSITSEGLAQIRIDAARPFNPHIRYGRADLRGARCIYG